MCEEIAQMAHRGDCAIVTSAITLAEVVRPRHKGKPEMTEEEDKQILAFFSNPFIRFVDLTPPLAAQSRQLQWRYGLGVRDAIHVVSAIAAKATVIESYDPDLRQVDPKSVPGCPDIREPTGKPLPLFDRPGS